MGLRYYESSAALISWILLCPPLLSRMLQRKFREEISHPLRARERERERIREEMGLRYGFNIRFVASRKLEDLGRGSSFRFEFYSR